MPSRFGTKQLERCLAAKIEESELASLSEEWAKFAGQARKMFKGQRNNEGGEEGIVKENCPSRP
jgi:hypothetical protein